jgi:hypothetical protein
LVAALLLLVANFGAPAFSIAMGRASSSIVYVRQSRRAQREMAEHRKPTAIPHRDTARIANANTQAPPRLLDQSLFQRPPPSAFLARS